MKIIDLHGVRHKDANSILEQNLLGYDKPYLDTQIIHGNSAEFFLLFVEFLDLHDFRYHMMSWNQGKTIIVG